MRLVGVLSLIAVLLVGFFQIAQGIPTQQATAPSVPRAPESDLRLTELEARVAALSSQLQAAEQAQPEPQVGGIPPQEPQAPSGGCRVVLDGYLETSQVIGAPDAQFVHAVYWFQGQPEYNVLLDGAQWQRPSGAGGRFWAYGGGGCTAEFVRANIAGHIERTTLAGVNTGGWGDPALFTRVS